MRAAVLRAASLSIGTAMLDQRGDLSALVEEQFS